MGMRLIVEIVMDYPDLSMHKHAEELRHHLRKAMVKNVNIIEDINIEEMANLMSKRKIAVLPVELKLVEDETKDTV